MAHAAFRAVIVVMGCLVAVGYASAEEKKGKKEDAKKPMTVEEMVKKFDKNKDSKLSLKEFKAAPMGQQLGEKAEATFKKIDADKDGRLSIKELKDFQKRIESRQKDAGSKSVKK